MNSMYKQLSYDIKELDEKQGVVVAYANTYNVKDSDGDISAPGSFNRTVKNNFKRIRVLKDHDPRISLGVPLNIDTEDPYGLLTTTKFNLKKSVSQDMFSDILLMKENGLNAELSIGYRVISRNQKQKSIIEEYKLMEYSFLSSWAANELSVVQDIKSIKSVHGILELIEKSYDLDYSDHRLKQIEKLLIALNSKDSSESDTLSVDPLSIQTIKSFTQNLN